jgi:cytochrome c-type biogenesis protein CcmH
MTRPPGQGLRRGAGLALIFAGLLAAGQSFAPAATAATTATAAATATGATADTAAVDSNGQLLDPSLQERFERITHELRCLVCQNESIADSNVELAGDLRRQVREMLVAGQSDDAIFGFMTDRYGDFVRFRPPLAARTVAIWGAPFVMLLLGGVIIFRVMRHRSRMPLGDEPVSGSEIK